MTADPPSLENLLFTYITCTILHVLSKSNVEFGKKYLKMCWSQIYEVTHHMPASVITRSSYLFTQCDFLTFRLVHLTFISASMPQPNPIGNKQTKKT